MKTTNDPAAFGAEVRAALVSCTENVEQFRAGSGSFSETVAAFDQLLAPLNGRAGRVHLFTNVHPDEAMRNVCEELEQEIARLTTGLGLDRGLYDRLAGVAPPADATPEERRLHEHALRDFRRNGVDRDEATRERIRALQEELVLIGQEFDKNIITGGRQLVVSEGHAGLGGLPADFLATHPEREDGSVLLTTDPTDRVPVMTYARDEGLRKRYLHEYSNRACPENLDVLPSTLR